ncbi:MAG: diaminopimelate decarboxylase [Chloroflexi bacterium]|nr:diaminopimelate decarboxylase [Chloroflexota bacterium]MDA1147640.1 diaminopimelate decarboxylase [Chloroflexota bacterium]
MIGERFGTPVYTYDAALMRERVATLGRFDLVRYAQKASSNTHLLRLLRELGVAVDAVSGGEVERALRVGYTGQGEPADLVFTADIVDEATLRLVTERDIPVNAGSVDMLRQLGERHRGHRVWLRINPGFGHGHSRKTNTGGESSKHGIWHEDLPDALAVIDEFELDLVGLHMHIGSGTDFEHLQLVAGAMVEQVQSLGRDVRAVSCGGGLPIPYRAGDAGIDVDAYYEVWDAARRDIARSLEHDVSLEIEPGRYLAAEAGQLIAEVRAVKRTSLSRFALVDAGFNDLMRPVMYGSYHEISVVHRDGSVDGGPTERTVVGGPLCESGDVFTQEEGGLVVPRDLPSVEVGDYLVFHDTGAYGSSMASNYNTRGLAPEVLIEDGEPRLIRRRQTVDDLLALEDV